MGSEWFALYEQSLWLLRDGATVHINYKAQFTEQASGKGRKKAASRSDQHQIDADNDCEILDMDDEGERHMHAGQVGSSRGRKSCTSGRRAREGEGEQAEGSHGRWVHHNNHNVGSIIPLRLAYLCDFFLLFLAQTMYHYLQSCVGRPCYFESASKCVYYCIFP